jgi:hypothetical protein
LKVNLCKLVLLKAIGFSLVKQILFYFMNLRVLETFWLFLLPPIH